jgi:predicted TIM-barrel fold metal-dependent hydrolase
MAQAFPFDIMTFIRNVSVDRLQYGSDVPYQSPRVEQEKLRVIGLSEEDLEQVFWRNAAKIWGVDSAETRAHAGAKIEKT